MQGSHGETFAGQSASRANLLSKVLTVCGDYFASRITCLASQKTTNKTGLIIFAS